MPVEVKRDRFGIYEYSNGLVKVDITDTIDRIWMLYHPDKVSWTWSIERFYISDKSCVIEVLADRDWIQTIALLHPTKPMRESTLKSIFRKYTLCSPMSKQAVEILKREIQLNGYSQDYFYHADRFSKSNALYVLDRVFGGYIDAHENKS